MNKLPRRNIGCSIPCTPELNAQRDIAHGDLIRFIEPADGRERLTGYHLASTHDRQPVAWMMRRPKDAKFHLLCATISKSRKMRANHHARMLQLAGWKRKFHPDAAHTWMLRDTNHFGEPIWRNNLDIVVQE